MGSHTEALVINKTPSQLTMNNTSYISNEDKLFMSNMSQQVGYPGQGGQYQPQCQAPCQGSFVLTVQAGHVTSWRPHHLHQVDNLAEAMGNMNVQDQINNVNDVYLKMKRL